MFNTTRKHNYKYNPLFTNVKNIAFFKVSMQEALQKLPVVPA